MMTDAELAQEARKIDGEKRERAAIERRGYSRPREASSNYPDTWTGWTCDICGCSVNRVTLHRTVCKFLAGEGGET